MTNFSNRMPMSPHMHQCSSKKGFTLIELLLVITIIAIIFAISIPNFTTNSGRQRMLAAANSVVTQIRNAQTYVLTGEIYGQSVSTGVGVDIYKDPTDPSYSRLTVFLNRDADPFFADGGSGLKKCSEILPQSEFCTAMCNQCLVDSSTCGPFVTPGSCRDFLDADYSIFQMIFGPKSDKPDFNNLAIGKMRLLDAKRQWDPEEIYHFMIHFRRPNADTALVLEQPEVSRREDTSQNLPPSENYFYGCFEVKARIADPNSPVLSRVVYIDRTGGFVRLFSTWPVDLCGTY